jgi:hypothetical protein
MRLPFDIDGLRGNQRVDDRARLLAELRFELPQRPALAYLLHEARPVLGIGPSAQVERRATAQLFAGIAEKLEPALVHLKVASVAQPADDDGARARLEYLREALLRLAHAKLRVFPFGDVEHDSGHSQRPPAGVSFDHPALAQDPDPLSRAVPDPGFLGVVGRVALQALQLRRDQGVQVLGVDHFPQPLNARLGPDGIEPQRFGPSLVEMHRPAADVPLPERCS